MHLIRKETVCPTQWQVAMEERILIRTTHQCGRPRIPSTNCMHLIRKEMVCPTQWQAAMEERILIRTTHQCGRPRIPSTNCMHLIRKEMVCPTQWQAAMEERILIRTIHQCGRHRIPCGRTTILLCKMGKMQPSQAAVMTRSPLKLPPKMLTNWKKILNWSLARVCAKPGKKTRFWRTESTGQLCLKKSASQVDAKPRQTTRRWRKESAGYLFITKSKRKLSKRTPWWKFSDNTMAKSRIRFENWLQLKLNWLLSKWTSGFSTKENVKERSLKTVLAPERTKPLSLPSLKAINVSNPSSTLNESRRLS